MEINSTLKDLTSRFKNCYGIDFCQSYGRLSLEKNKKFCKNYPEFKKCFHRKEEFISLEEIPKLNLDDYLIQ